MRKLLLISITVLSIGCAKESQCIRCESANDAFDGCKGKDLHEETDMVELARYFIDNGYECESYID